MEQNPIRAIGERAIELGPELIAHLGFGQTEITKKINGGVITEVVGRTFRLPCGCRVMRHEECGSPCYYCRAELEQKQLEGVIPETLSPAELDWLATPCRDSRHYRQCQYGFCGMSLCFRHFAEGPDGRTYCPEHLKDVTEEHDFEQLKQEKGAAYARIRRFIKSLSFEDFYHRNNGG